MEPPVSPFDFGSTVNQVKFTNRTEDLSRLKANMAAGINTILISPRRWGKSSLVEQAAIELRKERKNTRVAILDMFAYNSCEEFLENLSREVITASSNKWQERMADAKTFFKSVAPRISLGSELEGQQSLGFDWK